MAKVKKSTPHIRDRELQRLELYAKALGITVIHIKAPNKKETPCYAFYTSDENNPKITVYSWPTQTKVCKIVTLIHELAHHLHWLALDKQEDQILNHAIDAEWNKTTKEIVPKEHRYLIYKDELDASQFWSEIVTAVNIKIKPNIIERQRFRDVWVYEFYYETGRFPRQNEVNAALAKFDKSNKKRKKKKNKR